MKGWLLTSAIVMFGMAAGVWAHPPAENAPWSAQEDWRFINAVSNPEAVLFMANGLTKRNGDLVETELLLVSRQAGPNGNQKNFHLRIDCANSTYIETSEQSFGPGGPFPPPIRRSVERTAAPGTVMGDVVERACGLKPFETGGLDDPLAWADRLFKSATP
jgi:hypothetical protein